MALFCKTKQWLLMDIAHTLVGTCCLLPNDSQNSCFIRIRHKCEIKRLICDRLCTGSSLFTVFYAYSLSFCILVLLLFLVNSNTNQLVLITLTLFNNPSIHHTCSRISVRIAGSLSFYWLLNHV